MSDSIGSLRFYVLWPAVILNVAFVLAFVLGFLVPRRRVEWRSMGLFMLVASLLIQWPTKITVLMAPMLFVRYVRLARREEPDLEAQFGDAYRAYRTRTPPFVPRLRPQRSLQGQPVIDH